MAMSKRYLKLRAQRKMYLRVLITPLRYKLAEPYDNYHSIQQRLLSSKHLDDGGNMYHTYLALNNGYVKTFNEIQRTLKARISKRPGKQYSNAGKLSKLLHKPIIDLKADHIFSSETKAVETEDARIARYLSGPRVYRTKP